MTRFPGLLRAKLVVSRHGVAIILALGLVGVLSLGAAGWTYANPSTTEVTDRTHEQTVAVSLDTSAIVEGDSVLYPSGTRIENKPIYFTSSTPNLTLSGRAAVPDDHPVRATQRLALVVRARHDGESFWQRKEVLAETAETTSNGSVRTTAVVDVRRLQDRVDRIRDETGGADAVEVLVEIQTSYRTDRYAGNLSHTTPVRLSRSSYSVEEIAAEKTESTPRTREVTLPRDPLVYTAPAGLGIAALATMGVVGFFYARKERSEALEGQLHHARYSEWISEGTLSSALGTSHIPVNSLEGLVDVGVDAGKRIIYDAKAETYAVVDDGVVYYHPGSSDIAGGDRPESDRTSRSDGGD